LLCRSLSILWEKHDINKKGIENGITGDLLSIDLRKAIDSIGEITGQITNDEMLGNIFSNFCIGK